MFAFTRNRRSNALQLHNCVRFMVGGVSEWVNEYLNYLGLTSSRFTALLVFKTLLKHHESAIRKAMALTTSLPIALKICIDNIDMMQHVHQQSIGVRSHTYRGTWGYLHLPDNGLLDSLDVTHLSLESFHHALERVKSLDIHPYMFLPTKAEQAVKIQVIKSQIARVLYEYLSIPRDKTSAMLTEPPPLEVISHTPPDIIMLKLMDASDNSAEGISQVFHSILHQTGLPGGEFFGRLQPMDGDLGTIQNFNSLRAQRVPSSVPKNRLENEHFQLRASHTLWNIASTIFTHHFGEPSNVTNCGAWQFLEALGFPSEKAIQKKDFTLMINQMERVFEALVYYCLR